MVRITYDEQVDALYIKLLKNQIWRTIEAEENRIIIDLDKDNNVVGIEIVDMSHMLPKIGEFFNQHNIDKTAIRQELSRLRSLELIFA